MSTTRREFIQNGLSFVALGIAMPTFLMRSAAAQAAPAGSPFGGLPPIPTGKTLVVIEMAGGNDGLNTVIPYAAPEYAKFRPTIGIPAGNVVQIDNNLGLHPRLKPLGDLYEKGHLAVVTGVGYPNPNRSHFQSMDIWQTGRPEIDARERTGWLARYFDADGHFQGNPLSGISLGSALPLALFAGNVPASTIGNGRDYGFGVNGPDRAVQDSLKALYAEGTVAGSNAEFVRNVGSDAYASTEVLKKAMSDYDAGRSADTAKYPVNNGLAAGLQTIAKLISGGVGSRVYYLSMGGFDTHANQVGQHANLMGQLADAVTAFLADLSLHGKAEDVTVMTFSEFGRRCKENGSQGTDHGAASVMFVAGAGVKGGVYGDYPSLSDLDDGDLRYHTDYRSVYATLLDRWLGANSPAILGGQFQHLDFV
ncbi:MAG: DUF1501 domain-containing protein [Armatimonadetes bacterium]|nr:DUF1501 domain-containing protein [Armatimonadota bacterium]